MNFQLVFQLFIILKCVPLKSLTLIHMVANNTTKRDSTLEEH